MSSLADFLMTLPYFSTLNAKEAEQIAKGTYELSYTKGQILFFEGEPCQGLYLVKSGRVRIFKSSPEGREQILLIANPGDTFNDVPVFDGGPNPASASALETTTVYVITKETLLSLMADCPAALAIIQVLSARLRHLTIAIEDLSFRTVISRLAKLLLDLAVNAEGSSPVPRLTQDEMAAMVGSVRDVIGRVLRILENTGAIKIEGHRILVVDPRKLSAMI